MSDDDLFSDNAGIRDIRFPLRTTSKERAFLKDKARELGVRDASTLIRNCLRRCLLDGKLPLKKR